MFKRIFPIAVLSIGLALSLAVAGEVQAKTPIRLTGTVDPDSRSRSAVPARS